MGEAGRNAPSVNPRIVTQPMAAGAMLMDTASGDCFELNHLGFEIWTALCDGRSATEITDTLVQRYAADRATVASDVAALIEDLTRSGMLTVSVK